VWEKHCCLEKSSVAEVCHRCRGGKHAGFAIRHAVTLLLEVKPLDLINVRPVEAGIGKFPLGMKPVTVPLFDHMRRRTETKPVLMTDIVFSYQRATRTALLLEAVRLRVLSL